jgi:hypothetical protein
MKNSTILGAALAAVFLTGLAACDGDGKKDGDAQGDPDVVDTVDTVETDTPADVPVDTPTDIPADTPTDEAPPPPPPQKVDILAVIDSSGSMADEQAALKSAIPEMISSLLDPPIDPVSGERVHEPVRDVHAGVISVDMGVANYIVGTCETSPAAGDDGILQHATEAAGCSPDYPSYLSYTIGGTEEPDPADVSALSHDFGCIAVLGTQGCSFEQQLEAALKALTLHSLPGGANEGFLRDDSMLAVIFITDENDCSVSDTTLFDLSSMTYSPGLACYRQAAKLHPISRYVEGFGNLRAYPEYLVVGMIVGVPPGSVCNGWGDSIDGCLDLADMEERENAEGSSLEYVCKYPPECTPFSPDNPGDCLTEAIPARRFVEVAQGLGSSAFVQSICTDSYVPLMDAVAERIGELVGAPL